MSQGRRSLLGLEKQRLDKKFAQEGTKCSLCLLLLRAAHGVNCSRGLAPELVLGQQRTGPAAPGLRCLWNDGGLGEPVRWASARWRQ